MLQHDSCLIPELKLRKVSVDSLVFANLGRHLPASSCTSHVCAFAHPEWYILQHKKTAELKIKVILNLVGNFLMKQFFIRNIKLVKMGMICRISSLSTNVSCS